MSTRTVWKAVVVGPQTILNMPIGSTVVLVATRQNLPTLWFTANPDAALEQREFRVVGTGWHWDDEVWEHVGSALDDEFLWHVLERRRPS